MCPDRAGSPVPYAIVWELTSFCLSSLQPSPRLEIQHHLSKQGVTTPGFGKVAYSKGEAEINFLYMKQPELGK